MKDDLSLSQLQGSQDPALRLPLPPLSPRRSSPEVRAALSLHLTAACFSPQVLVVWDETSNKVRNYRIFEKVSRLPRRRPWVGGGPWPGAQKGAGQSLPIEQRVG